MKTLKAVLSIAVGIEGKRNDVKRVTVTLGNPTDITDAREMKRLIAEWNPDLPIECFTYTETEYL